MKTYPKLLDFRDIMNFRTCDLKTIFFSTIFNELSNI